jgi:hypothetical protein
MMARASNYIPQKPIKYVFNYDLKITKICSKKVLEVCTFNILKLFIDLITHENHD